MFENNVENSYKLIIELLEKAQNIGVFPSRVAGEDAYLAGAGVFHVLKKAGKNVSFIYSGDIPKDCEDAIDKHDVAKDVQKRSLIVSIDYSQTPATKVHYTTKDDILRLVLSPVSKEFNLSDITTELKGLDFDLIFTVGAQDFNDYGQIYRELENEFKNAKIVNLDNTNRNTRFGTVDIVDVTEANLCLLVLNNVTKWGLKVDNRAANALLKGAAKAL